MTAGERDDTAMDQPQADAGDQLGDKYHGAVVARRGGGSAVDNGTADRAAAVKAPLVAGGGIAAIIPQSFEDAYRVASVIAASGLAPADMRTPEKVMVAIMTGLELGLPPMFAVQKIAVINGRPCIWGDAVPALLWSKGFQIDERIEGTGDARVALCVIRRPNGAEVERSFSVAEAREARLWGKAGPWTQYPARMLQMRARGYAARDGAADLLAGLYLAEEMDEPMRDVTPPRKSSAAAKRDGTTSDFNGLRAAIAAAPSMTDLRQLKLDHAETVETWPERWAGLIDDEFEARTIQLQGSQGVHA